MCENTTVIVGYNQREYELCTMAGASECLWCTHGQLDKSAWERFIAEVKTRYGVLIPPNSIGKNRLKL